MTHRNWVPALLLAGLLTWGLPIAAAATSDAVRAAPTAAPVLFGDDDEGEDEGEGLKGLLENWLEQLFGEEVIDAVEEWVQQTFGLGGEDELDEDGDETEDEGEDDNEAGSAWF